MHLQLSSEQCCEHVSCPLISSQSAAARARTVPPTLTCAEHIEDAPRTCPKLHRNFPAVSSPNSSCPQSVAQFLDTGFHICGDCPPELRSIKLTELDGALLVRSADRVLPAVVASATLGLAHDALGALLREPDRAHLPEVAGSCTDPPFAWRRDAQSDRAASHPCWCHARSSSRTRHRERRALAGQTPGEQPLLGGGGLYRARPGGSGTCACPSAGRCGR